MAWIDTSLLRVIQWQILPKVNDPIQGEQFFAPYNPAIAAQFPGSSYNPAVTASGKVLFEAREGGFTQTVVEWDPVANTAELRSDAPIQGSW